MLSNICVISLILLSTALLVMAYGSKKKIEMLEINLRQAKDRIIALQIRNTLLEANSSKKKYDDNIKDAVFVAMKSSHPDNGGKQEDFVKFRKMYESMKG